MWRRVLLVLVAYSAIVVLGLAVPLATTVSRERLQRFTESRIASATYFADLADREPEIRGTELQQAVERYSALYGEGVVVVDRAGATRASAGLSARSPEVAEAVSEALRNQRTRISSGLTPWSPASVLVSQPIGTGSQVDGAVVIAASTSAAKRDVARYWAMIAGGALTMLLVGSLIAVALSRWTVRPLTALTTRVRSLRASIGGHVPDATEPRPDGLGDPRRSGPPEVRELARIFDAMADDVENATAAQRRLVADTAHALRNPLAAVRFRLDTLGLGLTGRSLASHEKTLVEIDRLDRIVEDLLALATAESRLAVSATGVCDVATVLVDRHDFWAGAFADAGLSASIALPSARPRSMIAALDEDDLIRVLDVLMSNAVNHAGPGASVELGCRSEGTRIRVWVADTGRGVPDDELPRVTERFFRAAAGSAPGSGLGLSIARALIEGAGGELAVSAGRTAGLRVDLWIPAADLAGGVQS
ncbi:sensor histidine kinase [Gordonia rubripertincta]|uniref:sensor histidine kinase n=1 Tax=Gordonia rubripertincta TaxID=36822 RepID=UPI0015FA1F34|nr:HAMP domain-containing sensor histidine kinase [Gordonia rubripertincta]QMU22942.1 HAMP domain-containing histidine kinase [Gordonia rubripertincta]